MHSPIYLSLSDITVIDSLKKNPHASKVEQEAERHCQSLGIHLNNLKDYNTMSAYLFPEASCERLLAITVFNNVLFYIDDQLDRNDSQTPDYEYRQQLFSRLIHTFLTGEVGDSRNVLEVATKSVRDLILPLASKQWLMRLIANTKKHLDATTYDSGVRLAKNGNELLEYFVQIREHDSGMVPTIDLIEFANDFYLPDFVHQHPVILQAERATTSAAALMNDIFSYHREVVLQKSDFNLVAVMSRAYKSNFEEALDASIRFINQKIEDFLALEAKLPQYGDDVLDANICAYYYGLRDQINAAWHWQLYGTNRYRSPESPFEELRYFIKASA